MSLSNTIVFLSLFYSFSLLESISGKLQNAANLGSYSQYLISFVSCQAEKLLEWKDTDRKPLLPDG